MRDGKAPIYMVERRDIERRSAQGISDLLTMAFDKFCAPAPATPTDRLRPELRAMPYVCARCLASFTVILLLICYFFKRAGSRMIV